MLAGRIGPRWRRTASRISRPPARAAAPSTARRAVQLDNLGQLVGEDSEGYGYSDGFDVITDFSVEEDVVFLLLQGREYHDEKVDTDGDGVADSTLIYFTVNGDVESEIENAGILLEGYTDFLVPLTGFDIGELSIVGLMGYDEIR